jgi:hypothetical protein
MPHLTFPLTSQGFSLIVVIGQNGPDARDAQAAGLPVPLPRAVQGVIDSGTDITCVATWIFADLGLKPHGQASSQTVACSINARTFEVSLSIPRGGHLTGPLLEIDDLIVMELPLAIPGIDVLIGRDVLNRCLFFYDGYQARFTLSD